MILQDIIFWVLSVAAIMAAFGVVFLNNIFRSALFLILVFLSFAGLYILLSAEFVAVVQLLVYVGAISILIILGKDNSEDLEQEYLLNTQHLQKK